jgi:hypothetical protein
LNRQYAESVGRFIRVDPSRGTVGLPQSLNRYAYVTNNPVNAVDPLGLFPIINFPLICPVVNGVARCGSLGSVNVSAGASDTLLGGGSGVLSDFYAVDESTSESPIDEADPQRQSEVDPYDPDGVEDCFDFVLYLLKLMREFRDKNEGAARLGLSLALTATSYGKENPTTGFEAALYANGQRGDMYEHIVAFSGLQLLVTLGGELGAWAQLTMNNAMALDLAQQASGRRESIAEVADDEAGKQLGDLIARGLKSEKDGAEAAIEMVKLLCEK